MTIRPGATSGFIVYLSENFLFLKD